MEIRETLSQHTYSRMRIDPPPAANAQWLAPARRRGRGSFSFGGLGKFVDGVIENGAIARELLLAVRHPRPAIVSASGMLRSEFFGAQAVQEDLHRLGFIDGSQITGSWKDTELVVAIQRWASVIGSPDCPSLSGMCAAVFGGDMPQFTGHEFEIKMNPEWRQLLGDMALAVYTTPALAEAQRLAIAAANPSSEHVLPTDGGPRMQTNLIRYGALAAGAAALGVVGWLFLRRHR